MSSRNRRSSRPLGDGAFPGIWRKWSGPVKKDRPNVDIETYAFATTELNALTRAINHERKPVVLADAADFETWLHGTAEEAFALLRPFDPTKMSIIQQGAQKQDMNAQIGLEK